MQMFIVNRLVRQLSGQGALDNVVQVLEARASIDADLVALAERVTPRSPVATEAPAAA